MADNIPYSQKSSYERLHHHLAGNGGRTILRRIEDISDEDNQGFIQLEPEEQVTETMDDTEEIENEDPVPEKPKKASRKKNLDSPKSSGSKKKKAETDTVILSTSAYLKLLEQRGETDKKPAAKRKAPAKKATPAVVEKAKPAAKKQKTDPVKDLTGPLLLSCKKCKKKVAPYDVVPELDKNNFPRIKGKCTICNSSVLSPTKRVKKETA